MSSAVKYATVILGGGAVFGLCLYPIAIAPYFESEKWSKYMLYIRPYMYKSAICQLFCLLSLINYIVNFPNKFPLP